MLTAFGEALIQSSLFGKHSKLGSNLIKKDDCFCHNTFISSRDSDKTLTGQQSIFENRFDWFRCQKWRNRNHSRRHRRKTTKKQTKKATRNEAAADHFGVPKTLFVVIREAAALELMLTEACGEGDVQLPKNIYHSGLPNLARSRRPK